MVRKLFVFITCIMLLGCTSDKSLESLQFEEYYKIQSSLIKQNRFTRTNDFDVQLVYNQIDNEFRYDLVINNPNKVMKDIIAMCYVDADYEDMFPNIGIFETDSYNLKKDYINKDENYYKGIMLSGTVLKKASAKLYVNYKDNNNKEVELFIEVNDEIR